MSHRTQIRDEIVNEFGKLKATEAGRVSDFDISTIWLTETETKQACTYCVIVTDEERTAGTLENDIYQLTGKVVLYAYDTKDARAKLDLMIEDAIDVLRRAFGAVGSWLQMAHPESVTTSEGSSIEGDWPQAVIRWTATHRRPVMT